MSFYSTRIAQLLHENASKPAEEQEFVAVTAPGSHDPHTCDVAYVLFLEPTADPDPNASLGESCIDTAIRLFQPVPTIAHCEILLPPVPATESMRVQFATYIGQISAWKTDASDNYNYYLKMNMGRWRALPVFGHNLTRKLRTECDQEVGVRYSLGRYITSSTAFRAFSWLVPKRRRSPGHCATLTARVISRAAPNTLKKSEAWYGPSSLFLELAENAKDEAIRMSASTRPQLSDVTTSALEVLLRGQLKTVQALGDDLCVEATRALTLKVCADLVDGDEVAQRISQKQLASALLKWVVLRNKP